MKKVFLALVISVLLIGFGLTQASAITVDGLLTTADEWDAFYFNASDPNEGNINNNYDIKKLNVWWDDVDTGNVYLRTDVYGTPSLDRLDPTNFNPAFYQWNFDTNGDLVADLTMLLDGDSVPDGSGFYPLAVYNTAPKTLLGYGLAKLDQIVEGYFPISLVSGYSEPENVFMVLDNAGGDPDDRLPNSGWNHIVPEPASMSLLGLGILGLLGLKRRKT